MLVVSHYPQVPLATSNVATDSARVENQQKTPVIPPKEATKGHEERGFNPQNERTADTAQQQARLQERVQGDLQRQQQQSQQEQAQPQKKAVVVAQQALPKTLKIGARSQGALQRKDIRIKSADGRPAQTTTNSQHPLPGQSAQFYQQLGQRINQFYQQQTQPEGEPALSTWI
ncbi:MAG TPA: hypothetical protein VLA24_10740 [Pseudomonadales bacterium]|nr:hypothetical protein [Pseudomonadales bacterium]